MKNYLIKKYAGCDNKFISHIQMNIKQGNMQQTQNRYGLHFQKLIDKILMRLF